MADKNSKALAEYGHNPKYDEAVNPAEASANARPLQAPASAAEVVQRRANKSNHSERVHHGGNVGSGSKAR